MKHAAVIDIGKTNAKVAVVDLVTLAEVALRKTPNQVLTDGLYPHADVEALWQFILESLHALHEEFCIDAIIVTTHGATAVLVDETGKLALPVLDYEFAGPEESSDSYNAVRPSFAETGSPRLPVGLNLGAQIYWQQQKFPEAFAKTKLLLPYPQYWSYRLSGIAAAEVTSLGCHADLWSPKSESYSSLVDHMRWSHLLPPLQKASDLLGPILPEVAERTGLKPDTPIYCGIHDSNASLVPHLIQRTKPCSVVSTGTWVISMALGSPLPDLDPTRDTLLNVNAFGQAVASARFMGGREFQQLMTDQITKTTVEDVDAVLSTATMLLPAVVHGSGPFPNSKAHWLGQSELSNAARQVAVSFYLALMIATCMELIGAEGDILVEGPFAANKVLLDMLTAATGRPVLIGSTAFTGTTIGAAMLIAPQPPPSAELHKPIHERTDALKAYAKVWNKRAGK